MSRKIPGRFWLLALPAGVALVASLMVPLALAQDRPASVVRQTTQGNGDGCTLQTNRPLHPLELNMETLGPRFKTIAMEKEIFQCPSVGGGEVGAETVSDGQIVDVETFIEIVERVSDDDDSGDNGENGDNGPVVTTDRRVEIVRCVKNFDAGRVDCRVRSLPLPRFNQNDPKADGPLAGCGFSKNNQPEDPVAMATAKTGGFVKTVKVEKEHLSCEGGPRDLYLFTEIIEAARRRGGPGTPVTIRPVQKHFDAVICQKNSGSADIESCASFNPQFDPF